ncbi:exported hypothetical protein [Rhodococcus sp. RD6.2]|nr:exported hypothetical protein [Rhodococcus sp. RD6.2]
MLRGGLTTALARATLLTPERSPGSSAGVGNPGTTVGDLVTAILTAAGTTPADAGL